jgi:hypothetical protein
MVKDQEEEMRNIDVLTILSLFIAHELRKIPSDMVPHDCGDMIEYFSRYVRLMHKNLEVTS